MMEIARTTTMMTIIRKSIMRQAQTDYSSTRRGTHVLCSRPLLARTPLEGVQTALCMMHLRSHWIVLVGSHYQNCN